MYDEERLRIQKIKWCTDVSQVSQHKSIYIAFVLVVLWSPSFFSTNGAREIYKTTN